ncbi:hypothetical protein C8R46DRAFT_1305589, partial [Mycena filopes]
MHFWLREEEKKLTIQFSSKEARPNKAKKDHQWLVKHIYVCARQGSGGKSKYVQKHRDRVRNIPARRAEDGCTCRLTVKTYPGTSVLLGLYLPDHSHPIGRENMVYTRISAETRAEIERLLREGMRPDLVLNKTRGLVHTEDGLLALGDQPARREEFINARDVHRIESSQKKIEAETVRLNANDGLSTLEWVAKLRERDSLLGFKATSDPPLPLSNLADDAFVLAIQTPYQHRCYEKWGKEFMGVDATHNTTYYENMSLFTL